MLMKHDDVISRLLEQSPELSGRYGIASLYLFGSVARDEARADSDIDLSEFTFAYPPTARIDAGKNPLDLSKNISIQFKSPDKPYQGMSIRLELNPKRLQGSEIANQLFEMSAQKQAPVGFSNSFKPITVGKASAIEASIPSLNTETTVIVPFGDKVFILSPVHDSVNTKVEKETLELFYKILTTFTFNISK